MLKGRSEPEQFAKAPAASEGAVHPAAFRAVSLVFYHYAARLGFPKGQPGLIAFKVRGSYIAQVRAKMYELRLRFGTSASSRQ